MRGLVFISYRRQRGYALAHLVNAELRARGLRTFLDVAESDPGKFWPQIQTAIHSCRALILICTSDSFQSRGGDDWVLREIEEATKLGRQIVPVFSQDFTAPPVLPPLLARAMENNGVSMDTQFHVAAFDHLSQLIGGRKRSEQRRRVALLWVLASLALVSALAFGARDINRLNVEANRERDARQAANARSEQLARDLAAMEKKTAEEREAVEQQQSRIDSRSKQLEQNLTALDLRAATEKSAADKRAEAEKREIEAEKMDAAEREKTAQYNAQARSYSCRQRCDSEAFFQCHGSCETRYPHIDANRDRCEEDCSNKRASCRANCT